MIVTTAARKVLDGLQGFREFFKAKPLGALGAVVIVFFILVGTFSTWVAPYNPLTIDMAYRLSPPSAAHLLGTDELGRDILSRIICGARVTLFVAFLSLLGGMVIGSILGITSAFFRRSDPIMQRVMDVLLVFPSLILALVIMAVLGQGVFNVIIALTITFIPRVNRVSRSAALSIRDFAYVEAAKVSGCSSFRIIFHHLLPNCVAPCLVYGAALLSTAVLLETSLSFLGLGVPPPTPSWGRSLSEAVPYMRHAPWASIFPGLVISIAVFAINLLADALRDTLDPRLRMR